MKTDKLAMSIFIVWMCLIIPLAAVMVTIGLARDFADSIVRKLGLLHRAQESMPIIDVYSEGDIPQPETSNIGDRVSVPR